MSNSTIMTIKEMIDSAFGEPDENIINFKLLQTILYILARQLRVLERRVGVEIDPIAFRTSSSVTITEVKLLANVSKKGKKITRGKDANNKSKGYATTKTTLVDTVTNKDEPTSSKSTTSKSITDKTTSSSLKTSTALSSSEKTKTSTDKSSLKTATEDFKKKFSSQDYHQLLENLEQQRERELRIVDQRADSREEAEKPPTPMASLDSIETQFEKLLIVERVSTEEAASKTDISSGKGRQLSIVTKDQFDKLAQTVKELQEKFNLPGKPMLPDNMQLMQDLRRGASLTDAMAALQLSARLEAAEGTLQQMMSLVTDLAIMKGVEIQEVQEVSGKSKLQKQYPKSRKKITQSASTDTLKFQSSSVREVSQPEIMEQEELVNLSEIKRNMIDFNEMDDAVREIYDSLMKSVKNVTNKIASNADNALKLGHSLEERIGTATNLINRMNNLETLVYDYAEQINTLDTGLSSQMTHYQEQLTQMQHDLDAGLESMAEALANTGGDTAAVGELNLNFTNLQMDFDTTNMRQKELKENQEVLSSGLQALWKQIEILRGTKSDRDEVADALRDKAGLGALNGLVTQQQFDAVRGDFEKRIGASYDKFNNQEIIWQKAIDDLLRELNEKADLVQVDSLRDDINSNLEKLRGSINIMMEIVGEPKSAAITKRLFHDTACLSCSSPAHMDIEEPNMIPSLPVFPNSSAHPGNIYTENVTTPKERGDYNLCYPGKPIPHPKHARSHYCRRYCGGSHTILQGTIKKAPAEMIITSTLPENEDAKVKVPINDEMDQKLKPCIPCNQTKFDKLSRQSSQMDGSVQERNESAMDDIQLNFFPKTTSMIKPDADSVSLNPPLPFDDD